MISPASVVFPLTSGQRYSPFVVTDQGQSTLAGERWPPMHLSLHLQQAVPGSAAESPGLLRVGSRKLALFAHRLRPTTGCSLANRPQQLQPLIPTGQPGKLTKQFRTKQLHSAAWKELSTLTTRQSAVPPGGEAGRRNSTAVLAFYLH